MARSLIPANITYFRQYAGIIAFLLALARPERKRNSGLSSSHQPETEPPQPVMANTPTRNTFH